jgi:creatinine amidohydrolase
MAGQIDPAWAGGHGGGEETAGVMAVDPSLVKTEYLELPEGIRNDLGDALPYDAWTNIRYKGVSVSVPRSIRAITDNGWLVHSFKGDVPTRATAEWGREMLDAVADYIADFAQHFEKTKLPGKVE